MSRESIFGKSFSKTINSEDILGKEVIDLEGKRIGVVEKVLIDPNSLDFIGLEVDKGFLKKGLSIGKSYIDKISESAVFLKIKVVYEIKNMIVFDKIGEKIGRVSELELFGERNKIKKLYIKRGIMGGKLEIPYHFIDIIGYNVILTVKKKRLLNYNKKISSKIS